MFQMRKVSLHKNDRHSDPLSGCTEPRFNMEPELLSLICFLSKDIRSASCEIWLVDLDHGE